MTQLYVRKHMVSQCCSLQLGVLQIHILEGQPSKRYHVHQQRAPDLCVPTFQLITGYTPIHFLSFFFGFRRPNLITGLSGWRAPNEPLRTREPVPDWRTGALPSLWQTQSDPQRVCKTDHNVGGLACILGLTNFHLI